MPSVQSFLSVATLASHAAAQDGNKATCLDQSGTTVAEEVSVVQTKIPAVASTGTPEVFGSFTAVYDGVDNTDAGAVAGKAVEMNINLDVSAITTWLGELQDDTTGEFDDVGSNPLAGIEVGEFLVGPSATETCNTTEFSWHIHTMWDNLNKDWAYGTECGPVNTGPHYDPTEKCGPAAECEEDSTDYDTTCGITTELQGGCELGDLSGRHGNLAATTTVASGSGLATTTISRGIKSSSEAIMDSFFPASDGFGPIFGGNGAETDIDSKPRSLVLHLTCSGTPRVFCAKLFSTIGVKKINSKVFADEQGNFPADDAADPAADAAADDAGNV